MLKPIKARRAADSEDAREAGLALEEFPDNGGAQNCLALAAHCRTVVRDAFAKRREHDIHAIKNFVSLVADNARAWEAEAKEKEGPLYDKLSDRYTRGVS